MAISGQTIADLLERLTTGWGEAKERKLGMLRGGLGELQRVAGMYGPGYMAGQERLALTGAKSALAARGLGGTTRPQGVSAGMKAGFEDVRRAGRAGAMTNMAQYMGGWQEEEATPGTLAHLATGGFGGMLAEKGLGVQEYAATTGRLATMEQAIATREAQRSAGGTARMPSGGISTPGSPYGGYGGAGTMAGVTTQAAGVGAGGEFGLPTAYYGAGGGWKDWEETGGKITNGTPEGMWENQITGEVSFSKTKPTGGYAPTGWMFVKKRPIGKTRIGGEFGGGAGGKSGGISTGGSW